MIFMIIDEGDSKEITIDKDKPLTVYTATPLITCFGLLFMWNNKAILYHAPSGTPSIDMLKQFSNRIMKDKFNLENVDIVIACSDSRSRAKFALDSCVGSLKTAGFTREPTIKEKHSCYSFDSFGSHAEILTSKETKKSTPTTGSSPSFRR